MSPWHTGWESNSESGYSINHCSVLCKVMLLSSTAIYSGSSGEKNKAVATYSYLPNMLINNSSSLHWYKTGTLYYWLAFLLSADMWLRLPFLVFHNSHNSRDDGASSSLFVNLFYLFCCLYAAMCHWLMELFTGVMKLDSIAIVDQIGVPRQTKMNISLQQNTD